MSIQTQIDRLNTAKSDIIAALNEKGVDASGAGLSDIAGLISAIEAGGGNISSFFSEYEHFETGTLIPAETISSSYNIYMETDFAGQDRDGIMNRLLFVIFYDGWGDLGTNSASNPIIAIIIAKDVNDTGSLFTFNRGYYRSGSSFKSLTSGSTTGSDTYAISNGVVSIGVKINATSSAKLVAGHSYRYFFMVRKET